MEKKKVWIMAGIIGVFLITIGISFALWYQVFEQTETNVVQTACFEVQFSEGDAITLNNAYPITESEGLKTKPYTFTIKNICETGASYQINLETISSSGKVLPDEYLKANISVGSASKVTSILNEQIQTEATIDGAVVSYKLLTGILNPKETKEFQLRLWMHEGVGAKEESMNATYKGKISIITSYYQMPTIVMGKKEIPIVTSGNELYEVNHPEIEFTEDFSNDLTETQTNVLKQTEYRYAGANPNNYVRFNNELWRIIGLVNTPEGKRLKIIRNEIIGEYSWDSSETGVNNGRGVNEWSQADLMSLLNEGAYYNRERGICYRGPNNVTDECDFREIGLTTESKSMVDTITWNTGSDGEVGFNNINTMTFYNLERSNYSSNKCTNIDNCNDNITRYTKWSGKVGLIYSSDYGYATIGGNNTNREMCLNTKLYDWDSIDECFTNNWLYSSETRQWTMMPASGNSRATGVFFIGFTARVGADNASNVFGVRPTLFLKSDVQFIDGLGTQEKPYELSK